MAGLGCGQGHGHSLAVAHLTHQDDIRTLAQGRAQSGGKALDVRADLALVDEAAPGLVHEFDGILESDDMASTATVHGFQHGGEGARFARAGRADDQHHAATGADQTPDAVGQMQLGERRRVPVDGTQGNGQAMRLGKDVHAKTLWPIVHIRRHPGQIHAARGFENEAARWLEKRIDEGTKLGFADGRGRGRREPVGRSDPQGLAG